ncbi:MAG: tRNA uridine-5-carboxymethylaminomethyl(34) synthesis enzyme MnmG [Rickettsiales bacterium]|nr:tRNA uridine-5-carboxymethylaminomethyl(34) synthesis enzyme MnmG [Rickettsiales bacterium]
MKNDQSFDIIIVGGGHAGCEAAYIAAEIGASSLLITPTRYNIGEMSCNPSIGGIAKGTIVREVDALGGIMGLAIDSAGIHYKMLNRKKGPAVWGPRAQADRKLYKHAMLNLIYSQHNITILEDRVDDILVKGKTAIGVVVSNNKKIFAKKIILTTGTFLNGFIHIGEETTSAGRVGEKASVGLAKFLKNCRFKMGRLKTGTPPRICKRSINYDLLEEQSGDLIPSPFSYMTERISLPQIKCFITYTNTRTHKIISDNLHQSSMYSGAITAKGPRYCPSIEAKVYNFPKKENHQVFLEPEGLDSELVYPSGISTSLDAYTQEKFLRSMVGLDDIVIVRHGYAIEYDFVDPRELKPTLETKKVTNLYFAGQINGTTGYEEAAGQGIVAGINAAISLKGESFILNRTDSYIGVMIDDLITHGVTEPYRVFTSRAEYRLLLRADNADARLTQYGYKIGSVSSARMGVFTKTQRELKYAIGSLKKKVFFPSELMKHNITTTQDGKGRSVYDLMSYPNVSLTELKKLYPELVNFNANILERVGIESKYSKYLKRQEEDIKLLKKYADFLIPKDFSVYNIPSLSSEVRERIMNAKPKTIGSLMRLPGITPAAVVTIIMYLTRK